MQQNQHKHRFELSKWFDEELSGRNVANIRFHLNDHRVEPYFRGDFYAQTARLFRNSYSRHFIKGVRRTGAMAKMIICLHQERGSHDETGTHLHVIAEYPEQNTISEVRNFVMQFCKHPRFDEISGKHFLLTKGNVYVEDARGVAESGYYNMRFGDETLLDIF